MTINTRQSKMKAKSFYFTCGQNHSHAIKGGKTWNKDSVLQVNAANEEDARERVFELFGQKWGFCYNEDTISMEYYPKGVCAVIYAKMPFGNTVLSGEAYELLTKLVLDLKSHLPEAERLYDPKDNAALVYNLFQGKYDFNYTQYQELFKAMCSFAQPID